MNRTSRLGRLVLALSLLPCLSPATLAQPARPMPDVVYAPSLSYRISSQVEIGIEKEGRYEKLITNTRKTEKIAGGSQSRSTSTLNERDTSKVRKKTTNPRKRATRPKASGLLGGVVRAVGGDYSGLVQWGGGFLDHMAEPRYNWDVTETYSTRENRKTTTSQSIESSWKNTSRLSEVVTEELKYDIGKGFIQFTVSLTNVGERTIHINRPNFIVHFVLEDSSELFVASARVLSGLESGGTISPGQSYLLQVRAEDMDFLSLSEKYRSATGIRIALQDLKVRSNGEMLAVSEVRERLRDSHVQFDYFDGERRSTRYLRIQPGVDLETFLDQALANKNYALGSEADGILVREINGLASDPSVFADLATERARFGWRRWFTSVVDDNGRAFEAHRSSSLYPGYAVKLGYFGAKDILPESEYRPVVYRQTGVRLALNSDSADRNTLYHLPLDLAPGDIIEFTDLDFGDNYYLNEVEFSLSPASAAEVQRAGQPAPTGGLYGMPSFGRNGPAFESWIQRVKTSGQQWFGPPPGDSDYYKLVPQRVKRVPVHPEALFMNRRDDFKPSENEALLLLRFMQSAGLRQRFVHYRNGEAAGPRQFQRASLSYNTAPGQSSGLREMMAAMGMMRRPGESDAAMLRRVLREEQVFQFEITEEVRRADNYWRFYAPEAYVSSGYIQLKKGTSVPTGTQTGYLLGDGAMVSAFEIQPQPPLGWAGGLAGGLPGPWGGNTRFDPRKYLYLPSIESPFLILHSERPELVLPADIGSDLTATLQVVRY